MELIWNSKTGNHLAKLIEIFSNCSQTIRVICPFIRVSEVRRLREANAFESTADIRVLTLWNADHFLRGISELNALAELLKLCSRIRVLRNEIHAKLYIAGSEKAVLTSANLTHGGLVGNLECGILLEGHIVQEAILGFDLEWRRAIEIKLSDVSQARQILESNAEHIKGLEKGINKLSADLAKKILQIPSLRDPEDERLLMELTPIQLERLGRPVRGEGGYQSLLRRIQSNVEGNVLCLSIEDCKRIVRYTERYGQGGWQDRLTAIVSAARQFVA